MSEQVSEQVSATERASKASRAKQEGRSKRMSERMRERCKQMSEQANGRATGPVLTSGFLVILDHSESWHSKKEDGNLFLNFAATLIVHKIFTTKSIKRFLRNPRGWRRSSYHGYRAKNDILPFHSGSHRFFTNLLPATY